MRCGCILKEDNKKSLITIRKTDPVTRGNKKLYLDYVCTKHNMELSTLLQCIIFGEVTMDFSKFIINIYIDWNKIIGEGVKAIAKSLKTNNSIHCILLRNLY